MAQKFPRANQPAFVAHVPKKRTALQTVPRATFLCVAQRVRRKFGGGSGGAKVLVCFGFILCFVVKSKQNNLLDLLIPEAPGLDEMLGQLNQAVPRIRSPLSPHASKDDCDYILYLPTPTKQILLYDMATSSSVWTYLKMNGLSGLMKHLTNAEFMSDKGRLPIVFERNNDAPMCGFMDVFWHVSRRLEYSPSLIELAYLNWVETNFLEAEMYTCWCHKPVLNDYTKNRFTFDLPWPVNAILFNKKQKEIQQSLGPKLKSFEDMLEKFNHFLTLLNKRIERQLQNEQTSFPSVDALIYGHIKAIETTNLNPMLLDSITRHRRLVKLKDLIDQKHPS